MKYLHPKSLLQPLLDQDDHHCFPGPGGFFAAWALSGLPWRIMDMAVGSGATRGKR